MAAWTTLDTDNLLQGEPLVEQETLAFYENPIAIAEGAPNAPKVVSAALNMLVGAGNTTTTFTNLGRVDKVLITGFAGTDGVTLASVDYRLSTNNGSSFGSPVPVVLAQASSGIPFQTAFTVVSLGSANNAIRITVTKSGNSVANFSILGVSGVAP